MFKFKNKINIKILNYINKKGIDYERKKEMLQVIFKELNCALSSMTRGMNKSVVLNSFYTPYI